MHARPIAGLALTFALFLSGCVDTLVPVEFIGLCGFSTDAACTPPQGKCTTYQNGQLYLFYENDSVLEMVAEVQNQRTNNADASTGAANSANARITSYHFEFKGSPAVALASRTVPFLTTPISAGGSATLFIPVLPAETVAELRATAGYQGFITVKVTPRGQFGDGSSFEVGPLDFPVQVLTGAPAASTCPDPADTPAFCPSEFQTHTLVCGAGTTAGGFSISGTVTGLTGAGLVLATPGLPNLPVAAGSTTFTFSTSVPDGTAYNVTVQTPPAGQACSVTGGSGTVAGANVTGIAVNCN